MNNKVKILTANLLIFLILASNIAQVNNVSSSILSDVKDQDGSKSPQASDFSQSYNLEGGNSMQIDASVAGDDGITTLTMDNSTGTSQETITSNFQKGTDPINNGSANTQIGTDKTIETVGDNKTVLQDSTTKLNVTIDNDFNPHGVDLEAPIGGDISIDASSDGTRLDSWGWENIDSFFDVTYDVDWINPGDQCLDISHMGLVSIYKDGLGNWMNITIGSDIYSFLPGGIVQHSNGGPWTPIGNVGDIDFIGVGSSLVSNNKTVTITNSVNFEIVLFFRGSLAYDISVYSLIENFILVWTAVSSIITIYWGIYWVYIFYLILVAELMYVVIYYDYDIKIEYYVTYIVIVWLEIIIEIWFLELYIYWVIYYVWVWWSITIEWWFIYETAYWYFIDYYVSIEYRWTIFHWYYYYYVPTLYVPNMLRLNIIESIYAENTFLFVVQVTDYLGAPVLGTSLVGSTWDEVPLTGANITDNGDGTFDINVTAKRVAVGSPGIELNITASMNGYAPASLIQDVSVYETIIPKELQIDLIEAVYTNMTFLFVVEIVNTTGSLQSAASLGGTWDGHALTGLNLTDNGDGTWDINVTAILVPKGSPGKTLALTATLVDHTPGTVNIIIAVDPESVNNKIFADDDDEDTSDDDDDDAADDDDDATAPLAIPGASFLLIGLISAISVVYLAKALSRKKKLPER